MKGEHFNAAGGRRPRAGISLLALVAVIGPLSVAFQANSVKGGPVVGPPPATRSAVRELAVVIQPIQGSSGPEAVDAAEEGPSMELRIQRILGTEASVGFGDLFVGATAAELEQLKLHEHLSIALTAAWEEVRRTFPSPPRRPEERSIKIDTERFVGYVEERLGCPVPDVWERAVTEARASDRLNAFFRRPYGSSYRPTDFGASVPRGASLTRRDGTVFLKSGKVSIPLADVVLAKTGHRRISPSLSQDEAYLAVHSMVFRQGTSVFRIHPRTGKVLWTTDVWGGLDVWVKTGPNWYHWVGFVREKDLLIVFGVATECAYIEGFSPLDGSNVFRFNTAYSLAFWNE